MKKTPTLFQRDPDKPKHVTSAVNPKCQWVLDGEGVATRKYDGTCVMFDGERWWARREVKPGKAAPENYVEIEHDDNTGKTVGWEPADQSPFAKFLAEAADQATVPGTYELCGPKVNGNPEGYDTHRLIEHMTAQVLDDAPRTYDELGEWLLAHDYEGIVWHHQDGRMAKIKKRDFA